MRYGIGDNRMDRGYSHAPQGFQTCIHYFSIAISEQEVPLSVAQYVIIHFLKNEIVESSEILSKIQVFDWTQKF